MILFRQQNVIDGGDDLFGGEGTFITAGTRRQLSFLAEETAFRQLYVSVEEGKRVGVVV